LKKQSIMKKFIYLFNLLGVCVLLSIASCNDNAINDVLSAKDNEVEVKSDLRIISSLGFDTTNVVITKSFYIVEGDIAFRKDKLKEYLATRQARSEFIVSVGYRFDIKVKISQNIPLLWQDATRAAISNWNSLGGLYMREVTDGDGDINVTGEYLNGAVAQSSGFPSGTGRPADGIMIDINSFYNYTSSQAVLIMTHEFGHCLGFRHTNWIVNESSFPAIGIPNTPTSGTNPDPNSIMNWDIAILNRSWSGFSFYDVNAHNSLYPINVEINGTEFFPKQLLYKPSSVYSYYTTNTPSGKHQWTIGHNGSTIINVTTNDNHLNLYLVATQNRDGKDDAFVFSVYSYDYKIIGNKTITVPDGYVFTTVPGSLPIEP